MGGISTLAKCMGGAHLCGMKTRGGETGLGCNCKTTKGVGTLGKMVMNPVERGLGCLWGEEKKTRASKGGGVGWKKRFTRFGTGCTGLEKKTIVTPWTKGLPSGGPVLAWEIRGVGL